MKRFLVGLSIFMTAALALASIRAAYRITLRNGAVVLARDVPVHRGSVVMFHLYPKGPLTSVPEEDVVGEATTVREVNDHVLQPGEVVVLGPTGAGQAPTPAAPTPYASSATPAISGGIDDPRNPFYGGYATPTISPNGQTMNLGTGAIPPPGDLGRAQSGAPPTLDTPIAPNGFPSTPGSAPVAIGPNGTPVLAPPGAPGSTQPPIGPNGTPNTSGQKQ